MIRILHLLWIVPVSACFGYFAAVLMMESARARREAEWEDDDDQT